MSIPYLKEKQKISPIRKRVGLVFQFPEYQLFEETVLKDIMFGPKNFGLTNEEAKEKALKAAELVGLKEELLEKSPLELVRTNEKSCDSGYFSYGT